MPCPNIPIGRLYNVNKSCQVIVGNPHIDQGLKVPAVSGHQGSQTLLEKSALVGYYQVRNQYKQRAGLSIYHTLTYTHLQHIVDEEQDIGARKKEATAVRRSSYSFGVLLLVLILSLRKLRGFLHLWFPQGKTLCSLSLVFDCCACYSLS